MKIKRLAGSTIVIKYSSGLVEYRKQNHLYFADEYVQALRSALNMVKANYKDVTIMQYRETIHTHSDLLAAAKMLDRYSTDIEVIEQVHHATVRQPNPNLFALLSSSSAVLGTVWAVATEEAA